ncbi:hypothetical protein [Streptomyces sp. NPDC049887]|uniref:hypothetical protein n=1 Tax=unclassified Streptomyces TaxID=2593676 RepID=UPI0034362616
MVIIMHGIVHLAVDSYRPTWTGRASFLVTGDVPEGFGYELKMKYTGAGRKGECTKLDGCRDGKRDGRRFRKDSKVICPPKTPVRTWKK